jgi:hypothetical protein
MRTRTAHEGEHFTSLIDEEMATGVNRSAGSLLCIEAIREALKLNAHEYVEVDDASNAIPVGDR